jgi:hypothetical protein
MDLVEQKDHSEYTLETSAIDYVTATEKDCFHLCAAAATAVRAKGATAEEVAVAFELVGQEMSVLEVRVVFHCCYYSAAVAVAAAAVAVSR